MKKRLLLMLCGVLAGALPAEAEPFTYQGLLSEDGQPANGVYHLHFWLIDDPEAGPPDDAKRKDEAPEVEVRNGLFSVAIEFHAHGRCLRHQTERAVDGPGHDEDLSRKVPLGIVGVLPTKVTLEGGAIAPGDLLVSSGFHSTGLNVEMAASHGRRGPRHHRSRLPRDVLYARLRRFSLGGAS